MSALLDRTRIGYFPIPESGCEQVKSLLFQIENGRLPETGEADALCPLTRLQPSDLRKSTGFYRFIVIRDPLERLLAFYARHIVQDNVLEAQNALWQTRLANLGALFTKANSRRLRHLPTRPSLGDFLRDYELYRAKYPVLFRRMRPAASFVGTDLLTYDRIYTLPELPELHHDLQVISGQSLTLPADPVSPAALRIDKSAVDWQAKRKVFKLFAQDYDLFGLYLKVPSAASLRQPQPLFRPAREIVQFGLDPAG